jgi:hypothetical protein
VGSGFSRISPFIQAIVALPLKRELIRIADHFFSTPAFQKLLIRSGTLRIPGWMKQYRNQSISFFLHLT